MAMGIVVEHLNKSFGSGVTAVRDLSFAAAPGKVTGFLGPNGAGKTTTLRCLLGLVAPTSGAATIDGVRTRLTLWAHPWKPVASTRPGPPVITCA